MAQDVDLALRIRADVRGAREDIRRVGAQVRELGQSGRTAGGGLQSLGGQTDRLARSLRGLSGIAMSAVGALSGLAGAFSLRAIIQATVAQEDALRQVEARIRSTGGAAQRTTDQLAAMASRLQAATTFGDETILGMQQVLLTFTAITGETFDRATETILDMATVMGQDLRSTAVQVGKALNDPVRGATALQRVGVQLTESQRELIKELAESGRLAEAQAVILAELQVEFGGAARAARGTFGGALKALGNAFGDLLEAHTGLPQAREEIERLTAALSDPQVQADMDRFVSGLVTGFAELAGNLPGVARHIDDIAQSLTVIAGIMAGGSLGRVFGPAGAGIGAGIGGLATAGFLFRDEVGRAMLPDRVQAQLDRPDPQTQMAGQFADLRARVLAGQDAVPPTRIRQGTGGRPATPSTAGSTAADTAAAKAAQQRADAIAKIIDSLREQAATEGMTAEQVALYRLAQQGADAATMARAQALIDTIQLTRDEAAAMDASREAAERQAEAIHQARMADQALLEDLAAELYLITLSERARAQETAERRLSAEATDEQRAAVRALAGALYDQQEAARETGEQMSEFAVQAARNMQTAFADFLFDPFSEGLDGMLRGFVDTLRRMASEALAAKIGEALFGSLAAGGAGAAAGGGGTGLIGGLLAGLFHTGGIAGQASAHRELPALAFLSAPRFHSGGIAGLGADEMPAILRREEEVLTRDDPRHRFNLGGSSEPPVVNIRNINAFDGSTIRDEMSSAAGERVILNVVSRNKRLLGID